MGTRPYNPVLGRFFGVDSVEGGTPNACLYVDDPINDRLAGDSDRVPGTSPDRELFSGYCD
jgi:hypothetical protein